jgi:hypothetical protein
VDKYLSYEKSKRLAELGYVVPVAAHRFLDGTAAPDCHDLLIEIANTGNFCNGLAFIDEKFCVQYWDKNGQSIGFDPNPVEALGAALIKLLEEKQ